MINSELPCDGCGRLASPDHIAHRLQSLEWATRFRPIHINILLLGAVAPTEDFDLIYSLAGDWRGEAKMLLTSLGVTTEGKSPNAILAEFQRGGFFLTHVLECP